MKTFNKLSMKAVLATAFTIASVNGALAFTACQVTDVGGIDDGSFNETAWKGVQDAMSEYGIDGRYVESQSGSDYEPNLNSMRDNNCDVIFAVGFLMGDATKAAAEANPAQNYSILDYLYDPTISNVIGQVYATNEAGFMAGYLAAGVSNTGVVGTFGGMNIPPVTAFMEGYAYGVAHYNAAKGANVQVLGWNPASQEGLFTGNFESLDDGRAFAQNLYDEGADIVMPVAGPVGLGSAALANELGPDALKIIGVDADWTVTDPERAHVYLTSVVKRMDNTVKAVIKQAMDGDFAGGVMVGNVANGGVSLAPYHSFDSAIPADLKAEVDAIRAGIIDGSVNVGG
ncbi:MAG: BMP family ABC transporter substrate-binding protein [Marinovum sp.]|jgi:basic membrane protein A|nr:BMP family ABC transporter substrate-binding protein [Marinovum sp.]MBT6532347.1 BMP family ABC transporter substrate-binding protein [Marinovum sp.]